MIRRSSHASPLHVLMVTRSPGGLPHMGDAGSVACSPCAWSLQLGISFPHMLATTFHMPEFFLLIYVGESFHPCFVLWVLGIMNLWFLKGGLLSAIKDNKSTELCKFWRPIPPLIWKLWERKCVLDTEFFRAHKAYDAYMEKYCMEIHNNKNMNRKILCANSPKEGKHG